MGMVFKPAPGGFVTAQPLPGGCWLVEGFTLSVSPWDEPDTPRSDVAFRLVVSEGEVPATVEEFVRDLPSEGS